MSQQPPSPFPPDAPNPYADEIPVPALPARRASPWKWVFLGLGVGVVLMLGCCIGAIAIGYVASKPPEDVFVTIDAPTRVAPGESFVIEIEIDNTSSSEHSVDSVDFFDAYTDGISIDDCSPSWRTVYTVFGFTTYEFKMAIPANTKKVLRFEVTAQYEGDYSGEVDVCINNAAACLPNVVRTIVSSE